MHITFVLASCPSYSFRSWFSPPPNRRCCTNKFTIPNNFIFEFSAQFSLKSLNHTTILFQITDAILSIKIPISFNNFFVLYQYISRAYSHSPSIPPTGATPFQGMCTCGTPPTRPGWASPTTSCRRGSSRHPPILWFSHGGCIPAGLVQIGLVAGTPRLGVGRGLSGIPDHRQFPQNLCGS